MSQIDLTADLSYIQNYENDCFQLESLSNLEHGGVEGNLWICGDTSSSDSFQRAGGVFAVSPQLDNKPRCCVCVCMAAFRVGSVKVSGVRRANWWVIGACVCQCDLCSFIYIFILHKVHTMNNQVEENMVHFTQQTFTLRSEWLLISFFFITVDVFYLKVATRSTSWWSPSPTYCHGNAYTWCFNHFNIGLCKALSHGNLIWYHISCDPQK